MYSFDYLLKLIVETLVIHICLLFCVDFQGVVVVPMENLHLDQVQQIVCVLESVILRCFGPDGGQVLFIRDTGQAMLSRSGSRVLSALRLEHPLAR